MGSRRQCLPQLIESPVAHRRRVFPSPIAGNWRIGCTCGWKAEIRATGLDGKGLITPERDKQLNFLFVAHIPPAKRRTYVLCDQRPDDRPDLTGWDPDTADDEPPMVECGTGNFIMPEGKPCTILSWYEADGFYRAVVRGFELGDRKVDMLVGEVRTRDGRVFRCE